jgi:hypothetical protein
MENGCPRPSREARVGTGASPVPAEQSSAGSRWRSCEFHPRHSEPAWTHGSSRMDISVHYFDLCVGGFPASTIAPEPAPAEDLRDCCQPVNASRGANGALYSQTAPSVPWFVRTFFATPAVREIPARILAFGAFA